MPQLLAVLLCLPLLSAALIVSGRGEFGQLPQLQRVTASLAALVIAAIGYLFDAAHPYAGTYLQLDACSCWLLLLTGTLYLAAAWLPGLAAEQGAADGRQVRRYLACRQLFACCLFALAASNNLGLLWLALMLLAVMPALLPTVCGTCRPAAAWHYLLAASVGLTLAFAGLLLLYYAQSGAMGSDHPLNMLYLQRAASMLNPALARLALLFFLVGELLLLAMAPMYASFAGSALPLHSAVLPGAFAAGCLYVLLRQLLLLMPLAGSAFIAALCLFFAGLLLLFALLSVLAGGWYWLAGGLLLANSGLMLAGMGVFTDVALQAVLLHLAGFAVLALLLFYLLGSITRATAVCAPRTAVLLLAAEWALLGLPPLGLCFSTFRIVTALFQSGHVLAGRCFIALYLCLLAACFYRSKRLLRGSSTCAPAAALPGVACWLSVGLLLLTCLVGAAWERLPWLAAVVQTAFAGVGG